MLLSQKNRRGLSSNYFNGHRSRLQWVHEILVKIFLLSILSGYLQVASSETANNITSGKGKNSSSFSDAITNKTWWRASTQKSTSSEEMYYLSDSQGRRISREEEVYLIEKKWRYLAKDLEKEGGQIDPNSLTYKIRGFFSGRYISFKKISPVNATDQKSVPALEVIDLSGKTLYFALANGYAHRSEKYPNIEIENVKTMYFLPIEEINWVNPVLYYERADLPCSPINNMLRIQTSADDKVGRFMVAVLGEKVLKPVSKISDDSAYSGRCFGANQYLIMEPQNWAGPLKDDSIILKVGSSFSKKSGFLRINPRTALPDKNIRNVRSLDYSEFSRLKILIHQRQMGNTDRRCSNGVNPNCQETQAEKTIENHLEMQTNFRLIQLYLFPETEINSKYNK